MMNVMVWMRKEFRREKVWTLAWAMEDRYTYREKAKHGGNGGGDDTNVVEISNRGAFRRGT